MFMAARKTPTAILEEELEETSQEESDEFDNELGKSGEESTEGDF